MGRKIKNEKIPNPRGMRKFLYPDGAEMRIGDRIEIAYHRKHKQRVMGGIGIVKNIKTEYGSRYFEVVGDFQNYSTLYPDKVIQTRKWKISVHTTRFVPGINANVVDFVTLLENGKASKVKDDIEDVGMGMGLVKPIKYNGTLTNESKWSFHSPKVLTRGEVMDKILEMANGDYDGVYTRKDFRYVNGRKFKPSR